MAYFLFIDESGQDRREAPYEVLAGIAVEDSQIWPVITQIHDAEELHFGRRISASALELKAKKLLKRKTFEHAGMMEEIPKMERAILARALLEEGEAAKAERRPMQPKRQLAALAQAKIAFVQRVFEICALNRVRAFASIVDRDAPQPSGANLRKDYSYLFERYFYYLEEKQRQGVIVFDERDTQQCIVLLEQMVSYFKKTAKGRHRASHVIPEPFFVQSELTTLVQVADLAAYVTSWGVRIDGKMTRPARPDLKPLADQLCRMRYRAERDRNGQPFWIWSFAVIDDLRSRDERGED